MKVLSIILATMIFSQAFAAITFTCESKAQLEFFDNGTVRVTGTRPMPKTPQLIHSPDYGVRMAAMTMEMRMRRFDFTVHTNNIYNNSKVRLWSFDAKKMDGGPVYFQQRNGVSELIYVHNHQVVNAKCRKHGVTIPTSTEL